MLLEQSGARKELDDESFDTQQTAVLSCGASSLSDF